MKGPTTCYDHTGASETKGLHNLHDTCGYVLSVAGHYMHVMIEVKHSLIHKPSFSRHVYTHKADSGTVSRYSSFQLYSMHTTAIVHLRCYHVQGCKAASPFFVPDTTP